MGVGEGGWADWRGPAAPQVKPCIALTQINLASKIYSGSFIFAYTWPLLYDNIQKYFLSHLFSPTIFFFNDDTLICHNTIVFIHV